MKKRKPKWGKTLSPERQRALILRVLMRKRALYGDYLPRGVGFNHNIWLVDSAIVKAVADELGMTLPKTRG